ncbi:MAG: hypothetical protein AAGJ79_13290, partial [Verrucomicrobiota bacterium]
VVQDPPRMEIAEKQSMEMHDLQFAGWLRFSLIFPIFGAILIVAWWRNWTEPFRTDFDSEN